MFNKLKTSWQNFRVGFIYFLIKRTIKQENRQLLFKWFEMKEELISEYDFNMWVTKNILDQEEEE